MKAALVPSFNSEWEIRETPTPKPSANQVLIKIHASGLCYSDVHITNGELPFPINFPCILGDEPVGKIVEVGEGVTKVSLQEKKETVLVCPICKRRVADVNGVSEEKDYFVNNNKEQVSI
ncbi:MAG TPA: alcohol dehydrogenase catalytic domain-containing protein [Nitrososphaeraceae archaeon]|nr:alcohol dehydrogenase catalytic domain-containing protein [Nitrososphaeraceae archaeon]